MNRTFVARLAVVVTALLVLGGCDDGRKTAEAGRSVAAKDTVTTVCNALAGTAVPDELPQALRPSASDTVQRAEATGGKVVLLVSTASGVDDVVGRYKAALAADGFTVDHEDNEGREAEVFFSKGGRKGSLLIRKSSCPPGSTTYQLTFATA